MPLTELASSVGSWTTPRSEIEIAATLSGPATPRARLTRGTIPLSIQCHGLAQFTFPKAP